MSATSVIKSACCCVTPPCTNCPTGSIPPWCRRYIVDVDFLYQWGGNGGGPRVLWALPFSILLEDSFGLCGGDTNTCWFAPPFGGPLDYFMPTNPNCFSRLTSIGASITCYMSRINDVPPTIPRWVLNISFNMTNYNGFGCPQSTTGSIPLGFRFPLAMTSPCASITCLANGEVSVPHSSQSIGFPPYLNLTPMATNFPPPIFQNGFQISANLTASA